MNTRTATTLLFLFVLSLPTQAQEIAVKTIPVATGGQFLLFPSQNLSMGGVGIALDDAWHDPFVNPAKGINTQGFRFASAPVYYGVSMNEEFNQDGSSGRTLPVGLMARQDQFFGGAMMAWQELTQETRNDVFFITDASRVDFAFRPERNSTSLNNIYAWGMAGMQVPGTNLSVGMSAFVAGLNGLEGVRLLYLGGNRVDQSGQMSAFRAGLYQQWEDGRSAELVVLHHRFAMDHDMPRWNNEGEPITHTEQDRTRGWAVQTGYQQPVGEGWQVGAQLVGDWKYHPKIPNYDVMQIPRDPGNSSAYNMGIGLSRTIGQATFGLDLVYEPIWSHTWADALEDTPMTCAWCDAGIIPAGEMTVENFFRFHNSIARMGVRRAGDHVDFALGLNVHTYRYHLDQENFVTQIERSQDESWNEWTASLGLGYTFAEFQVRYQGLLTLGTGRPAVETGWRAFARADAAAFASDFIVAPAGSLTLQEARVLTHQVSIIVPLTE